MGRIRAVFFGTVLCFFAAAGAVFGEAGEGGGGSLRRFGIFIGANNGGRDRQTLRYAVSDARAVSRVFSEMGGIAGEDNLLLVEPSAGEINKRLAALGEQVDRAREARRRTEIVFYYSGHSTGEGLLLNREQYSYRELRDRINQIPADMRIVILDSCDSGAFTRLKGGSKVQPFLMDGSLSAAGYAFLTSSSAGEASQESDRIGSSFFTHSLLAGLRGAADTVGDGRVTLNELYRFAYTETLAQTETSIFGVQHPSYDIQVNGSGDVVLTDLRETSAVLAVAEDLTGRLSIRDGGDYLIAEISKTGPRPIELGLEPGFYRITLQQGDLLLRAEVDLAEGGRRLLTGDDFRVIPAGTARLRGGETEGDQGSPVLRPFDLQFIPLELFRLRKTEDADYTTIFLLGLLGAQGKNLAGIGFAGIGLLNTGWVRGMQLSGILNIAAEGVSGLQMGGLVNITAEAQRGVQVGGLVNIAGGGVSGLQLGGLVNITAEAQRGVQVGGLANIAGGGASGLQVGGLVNIAGGPVRGLQLGLVNIAGAESAAVQIGLVNITKDGILHPAVYLDDRGFMNLSFRSGSKYFYTVLSVGASRLPLGFTEFTLDRGNPDHILVERAGIGLEIPLKSMFIDFDVSAGNVINFDLPSSTATPFNLQARLSAGYTFSEHLGIFAGVSYDWYHFFGDGPFQAPPSRLLPEKLDGQNCQRLGFFGGVQF